MIRGEANYRNHLEKLRTGLGAASLSLIEQVSLEGRYQGVKLMDVPTKGKRRVVPKKGRWNDNDDVRVAGGASRAIPPDI